MRRGRGSDEEGKRNIWGEDEEGIRKGRGREEEGMRLGWVVNLLKQLYNIGRYSWFSVKSRGQKMNLLKTLRKCCTTYSGFPWIFSEFLNRKIWRYQRSKIEFSWFFAFFLHFQLIITLWGKKTKLQYIWG